jgi:hypothetical protein
MIKIPVVLDIDFITKIMEITCLKCDKPVSLKHHTMGRFSGVCGCGQEYTGTKRKSKIAGNIKVNNSYHRRSE